MSNLASAINEALANYLRNRGLDVAEVTGWDDSLKSDGYCETCHYEYVSVDIYYVTSEGENGLYQSYSTFSALMNEL